MAKDALKAAAKKLEKQLGQMVGSAHGYAKGFDEDPEDFLIIWSDDDEVEFPPKFEGFTVVKRGIPRAYNK